MGIRFSDEDINKHANHSAQARFFEDIKETIAADDSASLELREVAEQCLQSIAISYHSEVRALDTCDIKATVLVAGCLDVWVNRSTTNRYGDQPGLVARGRISCGARTQ